VARSPAPSEGSIQFTAVVRGAKSSFEQYAVSGAGLSADSPRYTRPYLAQRLTLEDPLGCKEQPRLLLSVRAGDRLVAMQTIVPFLCGNGPDCEARIQAGSHGREAHELFLDADGSLLKNTDFEHALARTCDWASSEGKPQAGSGTFQSDEGSCSDASRNATELSLHALTTAEPWGDADTCNGYLVGDGDGACTR